MESKKQKQRDKLTDTENKGQTGGCQRRRVGSGQIDEGSQNKLPGIKSVSPGGIMHSNADYS